MTTSAKSFTSRDVPWSKIGHVIDEENVDARRAAELGGLDFEVEMRKTSFQTADGAWRTVPSRRALVRTDTEQFFAHVSTDYKVVQYAEAFTFMDAINPRYVAAGTLSGGKRGFVVVQLPEHLTIDPQPNGESDEHGLYVVLQTSHDLSKAVEVAVLPLRYRCMNQLPFASFARGAQQRWSIKHVGDPIAKLDVAQRTLTQVERYATVFSAQVRELAAKRVTLDDLHHVVKTVLPNRPTRDEQVAAIQSAFTSNDAVGFTGTAWGAVNAVSEYFEHGRTSGSRTPQSRFTDGLTGTTAKYVRRTAQLLLSR